jgi:hypothetical protein
MVDFIKVKGQEIDLSTANTVNNSSLVRVFATGATVLTFANTSGTYGTFSMAAGSDEVFIKDPSDTVASSTLVKCVPVAYK